MATIFTLIMQGNIPGRILYEDEVCVVLLDIRPLHPGHALVVPRVEVDEWTDLDAETAAHLTRVAHRVANAQKSIIDCERVGLMIAGFEVPHVHVHVVPLQSMRNLDFSNADTNPDAGALDDMAAELKALLVESAS